MKINVALYLSFIFFIVACNTQNNKKKDIKKIYKYGMKRDLKGKKQKLPNVSQKIEVTIEPFSGNQIEVNPVKFVKLCPDMTSLVGTLDKVICDNDTLFALDKLTNTLFVFNSKGTVINKIHNIGSSKHEFIKLGDFCIDKQKRHIILYDVQLKKFLYYSFNGEFIKAYKCPVWSKEFLRLEDGSFCLLTLGNNFSGYNLIFTDSLHKISGKALKAQSRYYLNFFGGSLVNNYSDGTVSFTYPFSNSVFTFKDDSLFLKYHLDFIDEGFVFLRDKHRTMPNFKKELSSNNHRQLFSLGYHIENSKYAIFEFRDKKVGSNAIYSLKKKSVQIAQIKLKDSFVLTFPKFIDNDCFVSLIDAEWFVRYKDQLQKHLELSNFFDGFDENSNPVLVYYKLEV